MVHSVVDLTIWVLADYSDDLSLLKMHGSSDSIGFEASPCSVLFRFGQGRWPLRLEAAFFFNFLIILFLVDLAFKLLHSQVTFRLVVSLALLLKTEHISNLRQPAEGPLSHRRSVVYWRFVHIIEGGDVGCVPIDYCFALSAHHLVI